jgi:hypothetical protein
LYPLGHIGITCAAQDFVWWGLGIHKAQMLKTRQGWSLSNLCRANPMEKNEKIRPMKK